MATKQVVMEAAKYERDVYNEYLMYFLGLLHNSIEVVNLPEDVPKRYFLRVLFKNGKIGYGKGLYLPVSGVGIDVYGQPTQYVFTAYNGANFTLNADNCTILRINDQAYPIYPYLKLKAHQLANVETSIYQNLFATRTQAVYECQDNATLLSLQNAYKARKLGAEVLFQTGSMVGQSKLTVHDTGAEYLCDKLYDLKGEIYDEVLTRLGLMTANTDKRERVQSSEVNATIGTAYDNVYFMIDTFNNDAEKGGLDIRLKLNTTIEDYFKVVQTESNASTYDGDVN